MKYFSDWW